MRGEYVKAVCQELFGLICDFKLTHIEGIGVHNILEIAFLYMLLYSY